MKPVSLEYEVNRLLDILSRPVSKCCGQRRLERQFLKVFYVLDNKELLSSYSQEEVEKTSRLVEDLANRYGIRRKCS